MHKLRLVLPLLAVTSLLAACGSGGSTKLGAGDVAVVGKQHVTQADYDALLNVAKATYKQRGQAFPKQGTTQYESVKSSIVGSLVKQAEEEAAGDSLGVTVTDQQVQSSYTQLKQRVAPQGDKQYQAELKKAGFTDALFRRDVRLQLIDQQVQTKVMSNVSVSDKEALAYYRAHRSQYVQGPSRDVQYMLIKSKTLAQSLYKQLQSGNAKTWCTLAKKYSGDPSSKNNCGKATFTQGQTVKAFDTVLFSQPTGVVHAPVYDAQAYKAWFIIRPLSKIRPKATQAYDVVSAAIKQTLLGQKQSTAVKDWATNWQKSFCKGSKIKYQVGYTPSGGSDPCAATTTPATTT
jgi:peptidyl-prolyl cis-trans isomerase C